LRKAMLPFHQLAGLLIFLGCTATALLGISEYVAWHHRSVNQQIVSLIINQFLLNESCWTQGRQLCGRQLLSNVLGLSLIGFCASVSILVLNPRWKRRPLPEEECLSSLVDEEE
jgi:hypothetical protein